MTALDGIDVTDAALYADGIPHEVFARLRAEHPVWWNPQPPGIGGFDDAGFWVVSTHDLVRQVSRDGRLFSSWENTSMPRYADHAPRAFIENNRSLLLNMDPPEHTALRTIIMRGFTPRAIERLRGELTARAGRIVAAAAAAGTGDFVADVATEMPLQAIADLIGVPQDERDKIFDWSTTLTGRDDPDHAGGDPAATMGEIFAYAQRLAADRRTDPADDIVTTLVRAQDERDALTDTEFGFFLVLLMVAGSETTRDSITQGMLAFQDNPEQWALYRAEQPATAVDEIIRWASPVMSFQRTATADTELGGTAIAAGDRIVMLYASANFDETVFDDPMRFDITRAHNPHVAFGGTGPHYCLGTHLARMQVRLVFDALAATVPDMSLLADPARLRSGWLNAIKRAPVAYRPDASAPATGCPVAH